MSAAPTRELLTAFDRMHEAALGVRAVIAPGKDAVILARLWKTHGELVDELMQDYFNSRDPFILRQGYSVGKFAAQFSMLLARRARTTGLTPRPAVDWMTECAAHHGSACPHVIAHQARMRCYTTGQSDS